jgi:hypothetical protein
MLLFLVKRGIAKTVRAIFLVRGHTKNDCNRLFNLMKKIVYRKSDCFSQEELLEAVGSHEDVISVPVEEGEFFDFSRVEDVYLKKIVGDVNQTHIFEVLADDSDSMTVYECDGAVPKKLQLVKPKYKGEDWIGEALAMLFSAPKPLVGLQEIKWLELFDKWRPLIPVERQTYYYIKQPPSQEIRTKVRKHTGQAQKQRKERSRTEAAKKEEPQPLAKEGDELLGGKQPVASVPNTPQKI